MSELLFTSLSHGYGRRQVLHSVDWQVPRGLTLLYGPNGAGKSTLLQIAAAVLTPQTGSVQLANCNPAQSRAALREFHRRTSWLPQAPRLLAGLTVREHVSYAAWLKGSSRRDAVVAADAALAAVHLTDMAARNVRELSGGQQRRVAIAGALAHNAEVLLLDEPTAGLDPLERSGLWEVLREHAAERTILVATHDTTGGAEQADNAAVLLQGRLQGCFALAEFMASHGSLENAYVARVGAREGT